ncbi:MAG: class I SAM-dependent methyltransferase [Pirellulales bacterium]|nr:class I SAM-dependent methyltransferase [Pirellulales bacterium]
MSLASLKRIATRTAARMLPKRAARIRTNPHSADGFLDRVIKAGVWHRAVATNDLEHLAKYHREYWQGDRSRGFYDVAKERQLLVQEFGIDDQLVEFLQAHPNEFRNVVEFGCGDGRTLAHLADRLPGIEHLQGVDLNEVQNAANKRQYEDARLNFASADANSWTRQHARPGTLFVTSGGVLEYFPEQDLDTLFSKIATDLRPSAFVLIEPLAEGHDLERDKQSQIYGDENSFSHNYPHHLRNAGFVIVSETQHRALGHRWLCVLATVPA